MSIEELEAESGRIYDIIADIEAGEPPSLDDVQWMIQRIAELEEALLVAAEYLAEIGYPRENWHQFCAAHLEPHLSSEAIDRLKTRYRAALAGDAPKPIMVRCVDAKRRIAELEEALDMLAITTRKYRSLPRIDGDTIGRLEAELSKALEKSRAALGAKAAPEEGEDDS